MWAAGWFGHVCALYRCPSVCQYAWAVYGDYFLHVGPGTSVYLYRILIIHALERVVSGLRSQVPESCA